VKVQRGKVRAVRWWSRYTNGFGSRTSPSTARVWKISSYVLISAWTSLGSNWKNRGLMYKHICETCLDSSPFT
jgi:hypothetical protein